MSGNRGLWIYRAFVGLLLATFLIVALVGAAQGRAARDRCDAMGGQTWDSGHHCVLGDPQIVSTR